MNAKHLVVYLGIVCGGMLGTGLPLHAQTFSSGSTGSLGALAPVSNTTVILPADGILHYTTVTIPSGVTVTFQRNAANTPVTLLATGDVLITRILNLDGATGTGYASSGPTVYAGGLGGPGGYQGGQSGARGPTNNAGSAGQGPGGGAGSLTTSSYGGGASYGAPSTFVSLLLLVGGSGGGGLSERRACRPSGIHRKGWPQARFPEWPGRPEPVSC